jgi:hypothetical protein
MLQTFVQRQTRFHAANDNVDGVCELADEFLLATGDLEAKKPARQAECSRERNAGTGTRSIQSLLKPANTKSPINVTTPETAEPIQNTDTVMLHARLLDLVLDRLADPLLAVRRALLAIAQRLGGRVHLLAARGVAASAPPPARVRRHR